MDVRDAPMARVMGLSRGYRPPAQAHSGVPLLGHLNLAPDTIGACRALQYLRRDAGTHRLLLLDHLLLPLQQLQLALNLLRLVAAAGQAQRWGAGPRIRYRQKHAGRVEHATLAGRDEWSPGQ